MLVLTRGVGEGNSTSVECLFSTTPLPGVCGISTVVGSSVGAEGATMVVMAVGSVYAASAPQGRGSSARHAM